MNIRRMTLDDLAQVVAIDKVSFSLPWPERSFRFEIADNPASRAWVAELDGKVVGAIVAWLLVDEAHIATIATHPDFRRQGIAGKLLIHALEYMRSEGARISVLEVRESNAAAQEMYRKFGFEESGRRPRYYRDNSEDAILMTLNNLHVNAETGKQVDKAG
ncbi:MAG: ribosomal protein S18-alanine N-acetyltransferase [Anaerolineae bacterium]|nr:ribosomal protein S18-alanine N-acetyltransferase [Anaerolineae bacterium]MBL8105654.1 ribosomal protein S18-alanine N-acetyltransferase [Anaerolineales bacterium]MCC7188755.1 ribosomal protein S18-alanine N-acetyltransferase [Anaerolineales bacterium]